MLSVTPICCHRDNYAYLVRDPVSGDAAVVDPSDADTVIRAVLDAGARPVAVLCTHHHSDHVGGNLAVARQWPQIRIYGHASDRRRIPGQTDLLDDGAELRLGAERVRVLHVPGHTLGSVAFVAGQAVFTGDTLFSAGCGFILEGTAAMMHRSLSGVLASLDPDTRVYCGHEYTVNNLMFAQWVEPNNHAIEARLLRASALRARREPAVGESIRVELETNPFMRCRSAEIRASVGAGPETADADVLARLRRKKDEEF
jgi:hydroxyacylglutathione hydrolase